MKPEAEVNILIVSETKESRNFRDVLARVSPALNLTVRLVASSLLEALPDAVIIDEKELLLRATPANRSETRVRMGGEARAIITNIPTMINPFIVLFDENWSRGVEYYPEKSPPLMERAGAGKGEANKSRSEILEDSSLDSP